MAEDLLGTFEQLVLLSVLRLGDDAYGMTVRRAIEDRTGRSVSLGAVYATLERLESKKYLKSVRAAGGAERQGRARRFYTVRSSGLEVLQRSLNALDRMRDGLVFPG